MLKCFSNNNNREEDKGIPGASFCRDRPIFFSGFGLKEV